MSPVLHQQRFPAVNPMMTSPQSPNRNSYPAKGKYATSALAVLLSGAICLAGMGNADAQHAAPKTKSRPGQGSPAGHGSGSSPPAHGAPGMSGRPFTPTPSAVPKVIPGSDRDNRDWVPPDPEKLPADYRPPLKALEMTRLDKPLATQKELDDLKRDLSKYRTVITNGDLASEADKNLLKRGIRFRLAQLSDPLNRENLHKFREELTVRDMQFAAKNKTRPDDIRAFRTAFCDEIVKQAVPLLDNNFYVRLQVAILLGELDILPNDPRGGIQIQAYAPAAKPLVEILKDSNQPEAIKTAAANSLHRILKVGQPDSNLKSEIAQAAVDQLLPMDTHFWYQMRLVQLLSANDTIYDRAERKPYLWNTLLAILNDPKRNWLVRGEAARALGRIAYEPSVPAAKITQSLANFGVELASAMQSTPQDEAMLRSAFVKLYLAFQPLDDSDRDALKRNPGGLLANSTLGPQAKPVYEQLIPIIRAAIKKQAIPGDAVKNLQALGGEKPAAPPANAAASAAGTSSGNTRN